MLGLDGLSISLRNMISNEWPNLFKPHLNSTSCFVNQELKEAADFGLLYFKLPNKVRKCRLGRDSFGKTFLNVNNKNSLFATSSTVFTGKWLKSDAGSGVTHPNLMCHAAVTYVCFHVSREPKVWNFSTSKQVCHHQCHQSPAHHRVTTILGFTCFNTENLSETEEKTKTRQSR